MNDLSSRGRETLNDRVSSVLTADYTHTKLCKWLHGRISTAKCIDSASYMRDIDLFKLVGLVVLGEQQHDHYSF